MRRPLELWMRRAASAVFVCGEKIFVIHRQNYLTSFPGYTAFPGGKVDKEDSNKKAFHRIEGMENDILVALSREMKEELGIDIDTEQIKVEHLGNALTPKFNPYRFDTFFFKIILKQEIDFNLDKQEFKGGEWVRPSVLLKEYEAGKILAVPPTVLLIKKLSENNGDKAPFDLNLKYDDQNEIPMIESVKGVKQFLPLSNTLPPANRTNCFLLGEEVLVDPSPCDENELKKLISSLEGFSIKSIFLTHHHPDHHENSVAIAKHFGAQFKMSKDSFERITKKWGASYFSDCKVSFVKEGDVLAKSCGYDVMAYAVPGHDEGQLAPMREDKAWMIVGDLIQGVGTVVIGNDEGDMTKYFLSLEKVINLSPEVIFPSHGIGLGGVTYIEKTLKHRQMREEQVIKLLEQNKTPEQMLSIIYTDIDPALYPYALMNIHSHLKKINAK
ncbi:MAG: MBL fold metallo-hydrolase [Bacteriovoracaceae bacterium]